MFFSKIILHIHIFPVEMVFAPDRQRFEALLNEMQATVKNYGYDVILEYDMIHAKAKTGAD